MTEEEVEYKNIKNIRKIKCKMIKDNYYNCIIETYKPTITIPPIINYPKTSGLVYDHIEFGSIEPPDILIVFKENVECDINPHSRDKNTVANIVCHKSVLKEDN